MAKGKSITNYDSYAVTGTNFDDTIYNYQFGAGVWARGGNDVITNWKSASKIYGEDGNDHIKNYNTYGGYGTCTLDGGAGEDTIEASNSNGLSINGGEGDDVISLDSDVLDVVINYDEGEGNDLIYGFFPTDSNYDEMFGSHTLRIDGGTGTYSTSTINGGEDVVVTVGEGKITLVGAGMYDKESFHIEGYCIDDYIKYLTEGRDKYKNTLGNATILALGNNDSVYNSADNVSINGGAGSDTLVNTGSAGTIEGGSGNDLIKLLYHSSDNVVVYKSGDGNDTVTDFDETDTLQIGGGKGTYSTTQSGEDIIVNVGTGKITLEGAANLDTVNIDGVYKASTTLTVTNSTKSPVTVGSAIKTVDASKRTKAVKITGNKLANTISGGTKNDSLYGGAGNDSIVGNAGNDKLFGQAGNDKLFGGSGNDSLWGGAGNDSLWGGSGKDVFIYKPGEGTDRIFDYSSGDMLKILKSNGTAGGTFSKATFSGGNLTLAISGGGSVIFNNVSAGDKININGTIKTISGSTLK